MVGLNSDTKRCCTLANSRKRGFASNKIESLRTPKPEEVGVMTAWLKNQVYDLIPPRHYVDSKTERKECYDELKEIQNKYKNYYVLNTIAMEYRPKDAIWLNFPICLTKEKGKGIPPFHLLAYTKGGAPIKHHDAAIMFARSGISSEQAEEICKYLVNYLRGEICEMHEKAWRDPAVRQCYGAAPIYNYRVEANTVNINH